VFRGGFKRSGLFGLFGVIAVGAIVVVIGLSSEGQGDPKTTYALIFGVLGIFFALLFILQRADLDRVAGGDAKAVQRGVAEGREKIENPTTMEEQKLWAALAIKPMDNEAIKARGRMWDIGRSSQRLGMIVTLLIFLTVPPIYIFESFVPLFIGGPLIALAAIFGSVWALMPGGQMQEGYDQVGLAMAPLGFAVTERPTVSLETRDAVTGRVGPKMHGALVLSGERHGRPVSVQMEGGTSTVTVGESSHAFTAKSKKVKIESGPEGIVVTRKGGEQADWLCDLWLAERLADAA
jgi:hypothetical protein